MFLQIIFNNGDTTSCERNEHSSVVFIILEAWPCNWLITCCLSICTRSFYCSNHDFCSMVLVYLPCKVIMQLLYSEELISEYTHLYFHIQSHDSSFGDLVQAIYVFGFGVPLFIDVEVTHRVKWSLWSIHKMVLTAAYAFILFVRFSKWREELPRECHLQISIYRLFSYGNTNCNSSFYYSPTRILQIHHCHVRCQLSCTASLSACWIWSSLWQWVRINELE